MVEKELQKQVPQDPSGDDHLAKWVVLTGGTVVHGIHLVSDKLTGVVSEIMKLDAYKDNFGVRNIEFKNNGFPAGKVGMAYIDGGAIAINLEEIWSAALSALEEGKVKLAMTGTIWHELIMTVLHEIHHIDACRDSDYRLLAQEDPSGSDAEAEAWAKEILIDLAQKLEIEPVNLADMPFFKVKLMELMTTLPEEKWVVKARHQIEKGIMYHDEDNDITTKTFREYLRGIEDPKEEDDNWEQGVSAIDLIFNMDDGSAIDLIFNMDGGSVIKTAEVLPEPVIIKAEVVKDGGGPEDVDKVIVGTPAYVAAQAAHLAAGEDTPAKSEVIVVSANGDAAVMTDPPQPEVVASPAAALFAPLPAEAEEAQTAPAVTANFTDSVQLPENIAAEQAQIAAAAVATPATAPPATSYTPNGLSDTTIVAFLKDVYMRLYTHIFNKCGWQLNSDQGFTNPGAVLEPVSIADLIQLHQAPGLIMEYDTLNATGHLQPEECKGHIRGLVFSKSNQHGIPAFAIYLNINGQRVKRSLIAQNSAKITNGQYSSMALEARAGHAIAWLLSEDENKKFVAKIRDNIYEAL